jgi:hypothetical protein
VKGSATKKNSDMSFKLQDRIQGIKGLPGKYKRLLLAMAKHARNDGTNIYTAKQTLADEMGVDRKTVYRNMEVLVVTGLVIEAQSHMCSYEFCPKADRHYTEHGNHWTQAYNINVVALQNVTPLSKKSRPKMSQESRDILSESRVPKCHANLGIGNPVPLGLENESSVLTDGVSELVSESSSAAAPPAAVAPSSQGQTGLKPKPSAEAENVLKNLYPNQRPDGLDIEALNLLVNQRQYRGTDWEKFFAWQRTHKPAHLVFRKLETFLKGLEYSMNDYANHDWTKCRQCKPKAGTHAAKNPELHNPNSNWFKKELCLNCGEEHDYGKAFEQCKYNRPCPVCGKARSAHKDKKMCQAKAAAVGKGFEDEEAE